MASSIIHIAIANELNKKLKRDNSKLLIGTIAPDLSKHLGQTKTYSHFQDDNNKNIPNLEKFLLKYKNNLDDDFVLGYYIHLYTDYLWFKYFINEIYNENKSLITKLDGTVIKCEPNTAVKYIYNDYTNLNISVTEKYHLNLDIFYKPIPKFKNIIKEISMDKIELIIDKTKTIIEESKKRKSLLINIDNIDKFIKLSTKIIEENLKELKIIQN